MVPFRPTQEYMNELRATGLNLDLSDEERQESGKGRAWRMAVTNQCFFCSNEPTKIVGLARIKWRLVCKKDLTSAKVTFKISPNWPVQSSKHNLIWLKLDKPWRFCMEAPLRFPVVYLPNIFGFAWILATLNTVHQARSFDHVVSCTPNELIWFRLVNPIVSYPQYFCK